MPTYTVTYHPAAYRAFAKLDPIIQRRVSTAVDSLRDDPRPHGSKRLTGTDDLWRIRVGSYRVVYTIRDERLLVLVLKLGPRGSVYRDL